MAYTKNQIEEIKNKVLQYYRGHGGDHYPSDVAEELNLDAYLIFQITEELVKEGYLE